MSATSAFKKKLLHYSKHLSHTLDTLPLHNIPNITTYNVLQYAWDGWKQTIDTYADPSANTLLLGINPGPHGMVQTGVPFGAISSVKNWLNITPTILQPAIIHPTRPVHGLAYNKEEPSGTLLWNTVRTMFRTPSQFFKRCMILNYCPLAFFNEKGANLTPDKIPKEYRNDIEQACATHLTEYINAYNITRIIAIGRYAEKKAGELLQSIPNLTREISIIYVTHPSPLNPNHKKFPEEFRQCFKSC